MSVQSEWAADLFEAADELGYLIQEVRLGEVSLVPAGGPAGYDDAVFIRCVVLSGAHLRRVLLPLPKPEREP